MSFFSPRKKLAREAAQQMIAGHTSLLALWALRNAGVFEAMAHGPLDPAKHAAETNMSPETLAALVDYLAQRNILAAAADGTFTLTTLGQAILEHEAGVLDQLRAYQPTMAMLEHHLANLKVPAPARRNEAAVASQARRYGAEVHPTIAKAVVKSGATHLLDLQCDTGELLVHLAESNKKIAGVGLSNDGTMVRQANDLIAARNLEKRLIAVPASLLDVCLETRETFARTGITAQLWEKFDCVVACNAFSELMAQAPERAAAALARLPQAFPGATLILAEPCAGSRFERNYYAPELELMLKLARTQLQTADAWRASLTAAGFEVAAETALTTDGVTVFACKPRHVPAPKPIPSRPARAAD